MVLHRPFPLILYKRRPLILSVLLTFISLILTPMLNGAENSICDESLPLKRNDPLGYQMRGTRCEGRYDSPVLVTSGVSIVSLTRGFADFDLQQSTNLVVTWPSTAGISGVMLRGFALKPKAYYQMDAHPRESPYAWPVDVIRGLKLDRQTLGVIARTSRIVAGSNRNVYVPVTVTSELPRTADATGCDIVLWPGTELTEVFVTLNLVDSNGKVAAVVRDQQPLRYGYYPKERSIPIAIKPNEFKQTGIYHLKIGVTLLVGGASTIDEWILNTR